MTPELAVEMRTSGFGVLREMYGSTETGLIAWRDNPGEAFVLFDHWRRAGDNLLRLCPDGEEREVDAMDLLAWSGERSFTLSGRRDGAVQIGAVNVFPDAVAETLRNHPHIGDCRIAVGRRSDGAAHATRSGHQRLATSVRQVSILAEATERYADALSAQVRSEKAACVIAIRRMERLAADNEFELKVEEQ